MQHNKFEKWFEHFNRINSGEEDKDTAELAWRACKKAILKELEGFEGEYVCDVIDKIKNL